MSATIVSEPVVRISRPTVREATEEDRLLIRAVVNVLLETIEVAGRSGHDCAAVILKHTQTHPDHIRLFVENLPELIHYRVKRELLGMRGSPLASQALRKHG